MVQHVRFRVVSAISLVTALLCSSVVNAAAPAPVLHNDNPSANFGDWYTGAVPPQASSAKPVILFVQGLHSNYTTWTKTDSYYDAAYNAGYRTAFVQLKDSDGTGGNMWTNGPKLAEVIKKVAAYYGVPKINIIAHSKGGIDTQTALVHYGAAPYVNVVHQLSTPNKGSEVADMAYSNWTSWLAELLDKKDEAVYSLQTSYMAAYRSQTDSRPENALTKTYMSGGEGDDGWFSSTWFAHAVLPDEDDGLVSVASAMGLPYGIPNFTKNISHSEMRNASQTWNLVKPKLALGAASASVASGSASASENLLARPGVAEENTSFILRGGPLQGQRVTETFPLESGLTNLVMDVLTASEQTKVTLISPAGVRHDLQPGKPEGDEEVLFAGAVHHNFSLERPEKGEWKLEMSGSGDAYFMLARPEGKIKGQLKSPRKLFRKGESASVSVGFNGVKKWDAGSGTRGSTNKATLTRAEKANAAHTIQKMNELNVDAVNGDVQVNFQVPTEPGVYNLSFDISGLNERDEPVTRSVNYNFAVTDVSGKLD
ncbi:alpha/beta hydrolase [Paenibacillus lutrae]|uniref:Alpha/beta hydrolase n=1 Tax=Paenibacillus lutrae TaxID=2078573 RepID=A0A7X3K0Q2_9BACL|nr:alpha/beta hydrolase [Paenibacillus lutrae]MVP01479.1 alpha/beta hydrolase [Paenibacillus lutrae]